MKKLIAALTTAMFAVALVVVGAAAPASAHTPTLAGVSTCDSSTGTWSVTWTFTTTNVPKGVAASSKVTSYTPTASTLSSTDGVGTGTDLTFSTYSKNPQAGVLTRTGNWSVTFTQTGIVANTTKATASVHTDWSDKVSGTASATEKFSGVCSAPTAPPAPPSTPKDASASVSTTAATCSARETLVLGTPVNASFGQPVYSGSHYKVVAVALSGHKFADGPTVTNNNSTETFTGTLAGKLSSTDPTCVTTTPPVCIPASAVHYTYSPTENGGIIYVDNVPNSTNKLCAAFYVTATSWKYTQNNNTWPQQLDVVNDYYIDGPGEFPYSASVHCGQGDIYAATAVAGQPTPPQQLNGPSNPWTEHFLHDMGFKGDSPTYTTSALSCFTSVPVTGTPQTSIATCAAPGGNGLTLPAVAGGVWTVKSGSHTMTLPIGTGKNVGTVYGFGTYTITLGDGDTHDVYRVTASHATWTPVDISKIDCNTTVTPVVPTATPVAGCGTTGSILIPADSTEVKYSLQGDGHTGTNVVTATAQGAIEFAGNPPTQTMSWTFELGQPTQCISLTPGTPTVSAETCVAGNLVGGTITVENQVGLTFTINGGPSALDITPAVGTTTNLLAGTYSVTVAVDNSSTPNYVLAPNSTTSFTLVVGEAVDCRTISVTASSTDALCSSTPTGATPLTYVPGTITITPDADITYTISDGTTTTPLTSQITNVNAGTYTVTAQLTTAAQNAGAVLPVSSWGPFVIAPVNCTVATALVGDPSASSCFNLTGDTTLLSWVHTEAAEHVSYQIFPAGNPSAATALADGYTSELPGDYTVVATADNGYTLDVAGDTSSVTAQWNVTVADISDCLPTGATWHAGASADPAVCVSSTSQLGTIELTHLASEIGQVDYTITNSATDEVIDAGSTATSVQVGPGTYVVTAVAVTPGDGISTESTFNLVIDAAAAACGSLATLAFTGVSASVGILGLLLAGGMLFLGLAAVFIRLASRRSAS